MRLHFLTADVTLLGMLTVAFKPDPVFHYPTAPDVLNYLLQNRGTGADVLLIDLATTPDWARLIGFITSTPLRSIPLVTIASTDTYSALHPEVLDRITLPLRTPQTRAELGIVVASLRTLRHS